MSTGLLLDCDETVAQFLFSTQKWAPFKFDRALGLVTDGKLNGAVLFHFYNGCNVDLSYYGKATMTAGVVRCIARYLIMTFNPARLTVATSKRNKRFIRSFQRMGFKLEGMQRRYYGHKDCNRNTAVRFVMFRERINEIARLETPLKEQTSVKHAPSRLLTPLHVHG